MTYYLVTEVDGRRQLGVISPSLAYVWRWLCILEDCAVEVFGQERDGTVPRRWAA